jgi:uncharacterized protein YcbX
MTSRRRVGEIALTPVQGFELLHPHEVVVGERGVGENRRFCLIDGQGRRLRSSITPWTSHVRAQYESDLERLTVSFPDGRTVEGSALAQGAHTSFDAHGWIVEGHVLDGPWTEPLSQLAGHPVQLVRTIEPGKFREFPVSILSRASLQRLEREAGAKLDPRRFRMLFLLDGCAEHEEDEWSGRSVRLGTATLRVGEPVPRCAVVTRDPEIGKADIDVLRILNGYRKAMGDGAVPFGVYATVETPGRVRVGDTVEVL